MKISCYDLNVLVQRLEKLCTDGFQDDPVTADLLWSIIGRLRYRAGQLASSDEPEHDEPPKRTPFKARLGDAIRSTVRQREAALKKQDVIPPVGRNHRPPPPDLSSLMTDE
jgi:hypothetical protein